LKKQICVIGIDDFNFEMLNTFDESENYEYHSVLDVSDLQHRAKYSMQNLLDKAIFNVDALDISPDAIVGFWNFPVTCLTPLLARHYKLPHLPLDALIKCEHKYMSRLEQQKVLPDAVPEFDLVDPFDDQPLRSVEIEFPFWLKPMVSFASQLCFKVHNRKEFDEAISDIKKGIHRFADPFNYVLDETDVPETIKGIDGYYCIAEQPISGKQCTVEGYVHKGQVGFTGMFDSQRHPEHETFFSYEYPSSLSRITVEKMEKMSEVLLKSIGYDNSSFNIEYFYDDGKDEIWLLEINPRISQSHSDPFNKVDGAPNHKFMVEVALKKKPEFPHREGDFEVAAKFYYRVFDDGVVTNIPSEKDLESIRNEIPDMRIKIWVEEGIKLSELYDQDSYSYKLASIYLGAQNKEELYKKREYCFRLLNFKIDPVQ